MSFQVKVIAGVGAVMGAALLWILFFRTSDEQAIEALCRKGVEAAQSGDVDGVVALLSTSFKNNEGDYAHAVGRLKGAVPQLRGALEMTSFVAQVDGDAATATVGLRGHALGRELWRSALAMRFRKEDGVWKVTSADVIDR